MERLLLAICIPLQLLPGVLAQRVVPIGTGVDLVGVNAMTQHNGQLIVGGRYYNFNGVADPNLQAWDGTNHYLLGDAFDAGPSEPVEALALYGGNLIAAGTENTLNNIAQWDGTQWSSLGGGTNGRVLALAEHNGELYAGGWFTMAGGTAAAHIAKWDGNTWSAVGLGFNDNVFALASFDGELFAGGGFTADGAGDQIMEHLVKWDGTSWSPVSSGVNSSVMALLPFNNELWIAGTFTQDVDSAVNSPYVMIYVNGTLQAAPFAVTTPAIGLSAHPMLGLLTGLQGSSVLFNGSIAQTVRFPGTRAIMDFNGRTIIAGRGSSASYMDVAHIGALLPGKDLEHLDVSNINAGKTPWGVSFFQNAPVSQQFEVPKGSGKHTVVAFAPWLAGIANGFVHGMSPNYGQTGGCDAGPNALQSDTAYYNRYFQVWKLTQSQIDHHVAHWQDAGYAVPYMIASWPGNGNTNNGESDRLAPFNDLNVNGIYEPATGDSPSIRGDMALYSVSHPEVDTTMIGTIDMDVHTMHYAFGNSWDTFLHNTVFTNIKFINRSTLMVEDVRIGAWTDLDIGGANDDYMGCDTTLNTFFGYNGDGFDENGPGGQSGYLDHPPAQGVSFLNLPITGHVASTLAPDLGSEVYDLLSGTYQNGDPIITPDGDTTTFQYFGDPNDPLQWHEGSVGNEPNDRRGMGSVGPFTFAPGDTLCLDLAFVFAQDTLGTNLTSVTLLKQRVAQVRDWYAQQSIDCTGSYGITTAIAAPAKRNGSLSLYPNPASSELTVLRSGSDRAVVSVLSSTGARLIVQPWPTGADRMRLETGTLPAGIYLVEVIGATGRSVQRFVKATE